jgi:hypothetical protein
MAFNVTENIDFINSTEEHIEKIINILLQNNVYFSIIVKSSGVKMSPEITGAINNQSIYMRFDMIGYSFDTSVISNNILIFRAGFGSGKDIRESEVSMDLLNIIQIFIDKNPILINFADNYINIRKIIETENALNEQNIENNHKIDRAKLFKSKNRDLFGKKD